MQKIVLMMLLVVMAQFISATEEPEYVNVFIFKDMMITQSEGLGINEEALQILPGHTTGQWISSEVRTQINFNAVSVSWLGEGAQVFVRALNQAGEWSEWESIEYSDGDARFDSINIAYQIQVKLQKNEEQNNTHISQIAVSYNELKNINLESRDLDVYDFQDVAKPTVISRSEWGARPPKSGYTNHTPQKITIHHTWRPKATDYAGASTIRSIQNYHMDNNGWSDIGYHFLVGTYPSSGDTKIYQGRPETVVGAHTGGANTNNVGVNLIGDYTVESVHPNSYQTLVKLLGWLCSYYKISPSNIYGHRDLGSSECPGNILYNKLPQLRQDVKNYIDGNNGGQTGKLIGAIYDSAQGTSARISGAVVKLNSGHSFTTGTDGMYSFQLPIGKYTISVQKTGYQSASSSDTVYAGQDTWESIGLKK